RQGICGAGRRCDAVQIQHLILYITEFKALLCRAFFVSVQFNKTSFDVYVKDHRIQHRKQSSHISLLHGSLSYKRRRVPLSQPHFTYNDFIVGDSLQLGSKLVTAEEVIAFASEFDPQPFHMSEEAGKASILGGLSAS